MPDALRLALGTLTALRVPAPRVVDRRVARGAMIAAPAVGLLVGLVAAAMLLGVRLLPLGRSAPAAADALGAALAVATLALVTRGLHLDGLADTADAFGVKTAGADAEADRARRLDVMRAPDVGAFGVVAVALTLVVQVVALTACAVTGRGTVALVSACLVSRLALTWCTTTPVPGARVDGLGATVAGCVPVRAALATTAAVVLAVVTLGLLDDDRSGSLVLGLLAGAAAGLVLAVLVVLRCRSRLGGITGDVLGAVVELSTAAALVGTALLA